MYALKCLQITLLCEQLITNITGKSMLSTVCWCALRLSCCVNDLLQTSQVNRCSPLCALMCLQITLLCEQLIIHITGKQMLSTVCWCAFRLPCCVNDLLQTSQVNRCSPLCALMCLQITLLCEQLITHITGKQMLSTVCVLMWHQITLLCEWLITHTGAIYLPLNRDYSAPQMPYSIHDLNMDDPLHVWVRVLAKQAVKRPERTTLDQILNGNRNTI
jgi:hypothetical protein